MGYTKKSNKAKIWATKREQELKYKNKLKSLSSRNKIYCSQYFPLVKLGRNKSYYKRVYLSSSIDTKGFKRIMNKRVRKFNKHLLNGCSYRKLYNDIRDELY